MEIGKLACKHVNIPIDPNYKLDNVKECAIVNENMY